MPEYGYQRPSLLHSTLVSSMKGDVRGVNLNKRPCLLNESGKKKLSLVKRLYSETALKPFGNFYYYYYYAMAKDKYRVRSESDLLHTAHHTSTISGRVACQVWRGSNGNIIKWAPTDWSALSKFRRKNVYPTVSTSNQIIIIVIDNDIKVEIYVSHTHTHTQNDLTLPQMPLN